jgi:hypothetical protein
VRTFSKRTWFVVALTVYLVLSLWTLNLTHTVWFDEVIMFSLARSTFPEPPFLSVFERSDNIRHYVFSWVHSLALRPFMAVFGLSPTAARLPVLLASVLSAIVMRSVLLALSVRPLVANASALLLLADWVFASSVRGARPDSLAVAWALTSILLVVIGKTRRRSRSWMSLAGVCAAACLATWSTAMLLLFLVVLSLTWTSVRKPGELRASARNLLWLVLSGALVVGVLALVSLWPDTSARIAGFRATFVAELDFFRDGLPDSMADYLVRFTQFYALQPWMWLLWCLALPIAVVFPSWRGISSLLVAGLGIWVSSRTHFYAYRYVYALPALVFTLAFGFEAMLGWLEKRQHPLLGRLFAKFLILLVLMNFLVEPTARTIVAIAQREARDYGRVEAFFERRVQPGERVFGTCPAYYAVESRGATLIVRFLNLRSGHVEQFRTDSIEPTGVTGEWHLSDESPAYTNFLRTIDWIVTPYKANAADRLISADGEVAFNKVAELPPVETLWEIPWHRMFDSPEDYAFVLFRRER